MVGSSLQVFSAFRLARAAHQAGKPIAILNVGPTRADELSTLKVGCDAAEVLPRLVEALGQREVPSEARRRSAATTPTPTPTTSTTSTTTATSTTALLRPPSDGIVGFS